MHSDMCSNIEPHNSVLPVAKMLIRNHFYTEKRGSLLVKLECLQINLSLKIFSFWRRKVCDLL